MAFRNEYKLIPGTEEQGERQIKLRTSMNKGKKMQKYLEDNEHSTNSFSQQRLGFRKGILMVVWEQSGLEEVII